MHTKVKVLLAEDDMFLVFVIKDNLEEEGYEVVWCKDGEAALAWFSKPSFDICLLDVMMPKNGWLFIGKKNKTEKRCSSHYFFDSEIA